ncbi:PID-CTERM protein-sorting domain-containing protein [Hymenobacter terrenus]|uniref:PID-CTERM protein-sorting domain-containing protein n=1 Tax=Hymenobacter terrenus TaxID=1629124 RepID=UPI0012E0AA02|nr:hypothetical protein [Hymenobacter terrenus]
MAGSPAVAQPSSTSPGLSVPVTEMPLDGGALLLLAGGVGYGLRQLRACQLARC